MLACVSELRTRLTARDARCVQGLMCDGVRLAGSGTPRLITCPLVFSQYLRAAVPGSGGLSLRWSRLPGRNMEDLPAVEPVKIYENTYRLEPADNEK